VSGPLTARSSRPAVPPGFRVYSDDSTRLSVVRCLSVRQYEFPSQLISRGRDDYELFEEDGEFVLSVELPGFDTDDISVAWEDGVLNISAERADEQRGQRKTYHRRFRFPKHIEDDGITAEYTNGVLEVSLPVEEGATAWPRDRDSGVISAPSGRLDGQGPRHRRSVTAGRDRTTSG
jgi:HSP20 family protein